MFLVDPHVVIVSLDFVAESIRKLVVRHFALNAVDFVAKRS